MLKVQLSCSFSLLGAIWIFPIKTKNNPSNNICGKNVRRLRYKSTPSLSQREFAESLSKTGIELNKNAIQRIESGQRFVTDIELTAMAKVFGVTIEELIQQ